MAHAHHSGIQPAILFTTWLLVLFVSKIVSYLLISYRLTIALTHDNIIQRMLGYMPYTFIINPTHVSSILKGIFNYRHFLRFFRINTRRIPSCVGIFRALARFSCNIQLLRFTYFVYHTWPSITHLFRRLILNLRLLHG